MYYAFQDRENLYLVMDYLSGGDLRYHICRNRRFSEEITRKSKPKLPNQDSLHRLLRGVPSLWPRVLPREEHNSQRHQTRELGNRIRW
jgi:serine/threonine protein kinase